ncbi:hypothetical protein, partial [Burkholderia gladioli]|uniref:hypothetical protein n=1 Tax=Burkholderia gladioli TaxID=28095 RepID=UPI001ABA3DC8
FASRGSSVRSRLPPPIFNDKRSGQADSSLCHWRLSQSEDIEKYRLSFFNNLEEVVIWIAEASI